MSEKIKEQIIRLKEEHGACGLKMGTEAEASTFEDIQFLYSKAKGILPVIVKVGGVEAKNDIRTVSAMGIDGIIGPMVESPYGFKVFMDTLKLMAKNRFDELFKAINIESITAVENIDKIFQCDSIRELDQITIGRTDLSASMGLDINHPKVTETVKKIRDKAGAKGLLVSVGGGITPDSAQLIAREIGPDKINIRTVVISLNKCENLKDAIKSALQFEIDLLEYKEIECEEMAQEAKNRIAIIRKRLER